MMQPKQNGNGDGYMKSFYDAVAKQTAEDDRVLWVRESGPGLLEYAVPRIFEWSSDMNVDHISIAIIGGGGTVDDAYSLYSLLRGCGKPTTAVVYHAHSAGAIIALGCEERVGFHTTTVLLHDMHVTGAGPMRGDAITDLGDSMKIYREMYEEILTSRTKVSKKMFNENLRREWWMGAKEALKLGILTEIQ